MNKESIVMKIYADKKFVGYVKGMSPTNRLLLTDKIEEAIEFANSNAVADVCRGYQIQESAIAVRAVA